MSARRIAERMRQQLQVLACTVDYLGDPLRIGGDDEVHAAAASGRIAVEALTELVAAIETSAELAASLAAGEE